jgi:hypothetical protein
MDAHKFLTYDGCLMDFASAMQAASNPRTSPAQLAVLSTFDDARINAVIATNPNATRELLEEVWLSHPLGILRNPIVLYWSLSSGCEILMTLPPPVIIALYLALRKSTDGSCLESYLPTEERSGWLKNRPFKTWLTVCLNSDRISLSRIQNRYRTSDHRIHASLAAAFVLAIATDASPIVRRQVIEARHSWPIDISQRTDLERTLSQDSDEGVRYLLASSKQLTPAAHLILAGDPMPSIRIALSKNPYVSQAVSLEGWRLLVKSGQADEALSNPACPEALKLELILLGHPWKRPEAWADLSFHKLAGSTVGGRFKVHHLWAVQSAPL